MGMLHKYRKNITKQNTVFAPEMYDNMVGSLIITNYILTNEEDRPALSEINRMWKYIRKNGLDWWLDDKDFISKTLKLFNLTPHYGEFAFVQSRYNCLFAPFLDGTIFPIKENGIYSRTLKEGKIYPIVAEITNIIGEEDGQRTKKTD